MCLWKYDAGDCMEKEIAMKFWRRLRLSFPLEALGTMEIESRCLFPVYAFGLLWFFELDLRFCLCMVQGLSTLLWCRVVICSHGLLLVCFLCLPFKFWVLGIGWEREKLMELEKSWMKPTRWCKAQMNLTACIRAIEGKSMTTSWIGWVHWCKWTMAG